MRKVSLVITVSLEPKESPVCRGHKDREDTLVHRVPMVFPVKWGPRGLRLWITGSW